MDEIDNEQTRVSELWNENEHASRGRLMIESREIAKDQVNAAVGRADDNFAAGSVTASAAVASALIYLADAILFCFQPVIQAIERSEEDDVHTGID